MADDVLAVVQSRNEFYRDAHHRLMMALLLSIVALVGLTGSFIYMLMNPPSPKYFATTAQGRITPLVPLDQPNTSPAALLQWANMAAIAAYSYNFVNYREELQAASEFFTADGWRSYLDALKDSRNLDAVIAKKLIVSAVATGAPIILDQGVIDGRFTWKVQMPLLVTYQSSSDFSQQSVIVTMVVTRVPTLDSIRGIGIAQFIVASGSALG